MKGKKKKTPTAQARSNDVSWALYSFVVTRWVYGLSSMSGVGDPAWVPTVQDELVD